jgi:hypothetical protein
VDDGIPNADLTEPAVAAKRRFELEWILPLEPGLSTHVTLIDFESHSSHVVDMGQGGDEADALLDLWTTLSDRHAATEAIAFVAECYYRRAGQQPQRPK